MANALYDYGRNEFLNGNIDWVNDTIKAILVDTADYTVNLAADEEIQRLRAGIERGGMTVIATKCYFKRGRAKLEVALARGKRKHDKRQTMRERDAAREAEQAMRRVKIG